MPPSRRSSRVGADVDVPPPKKQAASDVDGRPIRAAPAVDVQEKSAVQKNMEVAPCDRAVSKVGGAPLSAEALRGLCATEVGGLARYIFGREFGNQVRKA